MCMLTIPIPFKKLNLVHYDLNKGIDKGLVYLWINDTSNKHINLSSIEQIVHFLQILK
jgi:hypothetical protein